MREARKRGRMEVKEVFVELNLMCKYTSF